MKTRFLFSIIVCCITLSIQAQKPFKELGLDHEVELLTLSNGRYTEHFTNDTLRQIGSVMFNIITNKVAYIIPEDELEAISIAQRDREVTRFMSVDPLAGKYSWNSPYAFSENVVINAVELEGAERKYVFNSIHTTTKFDKVFQEFQKGTRTFDEVTKYLDSRTGYRMGEKQRDIVRDKLTAGNEEYLGLDKHSGVPYIATDKDIANDNYIYVSIIVEREDGSYDRQEMEIVRDGYALDQGLTMEQVRNSGHYDPMEGNNDPANTGAWSELDKKIAKVPLYVAQFFLEAVQKVMFPIIVDDSFFDSSPLDTKPAPTFTVNGETPAVEQNVNQNKIESPGATKGEKKQSDKSNGGTPRII